MLLYAEGSWSQNSSQAQLSNSMIGQLHWIGTGGKAGEREKD